MVIVKKIKIIICRVSTYRIVVQIKIVTYNIILGDEAVIRLNTQRRSTRKKRTYFDNSTLIQLVQKGVLLKDKEQILTQLTISERNYVF